MEDLEEQPPVLCLIAKYGASPLEQCFKMYILLLTIGYKILAIQPSQSGERALKILPVQHRPCIPESFHSCFLW
jgi:hypothetical protein